ncbi:MAG: hypothetical protein PUC37_01325 [Spirochaetales bacterium]|nr:hypothetical protein [Spirochaetales bacterium]
MKKFGITTKHKLFVWLIISAFYLFAISFLVYEAIIGIKNYAAYFNLIFLVMFVPVFLTIMAIKQFSTYFIFFDNYFEYHKGRKTIRIEAKNLRYFYFNTGLLTIYFVKDGIHDFESSFCKESLVPENSKERQLALPEDKEMYKLVIGMGGIEDSDQILNWFFENLPILPDGQAMNDILGIIEKYNEPDFKDVNLVLEKAQKFASFINWISVIIAVWCALFPYPYRLSIELNLLLPIVLLFILHYSDGWIHFDKRGNSIYPTIILAGICPVFGLGWRMVNDYSFENSTGKFFIASFIFYLIYMILFMICQKEFSFKEKYTYGALLLYSIFFFGYAMGATAAINCLFDFSTPVKETVKESGQIIEVLMHKGLFGIKWY